MHLEESFRRWAARGLRESGGLALASQGARLKIRDRHGAASVKVDKSVADTDRKSWLEPSHAVT